MHQMDAVITRVRVIRFTRRAAFFPNMPLLDVRLGDPVVDVLDTRVSRGTRQVTRLGERFVATPWGEIPYERVHVLRSHP
jgi:hypothetical protein